MCICRLCHFCDLFAVCFNVRGVTERRFFCCCIWRAVEYYPFREAVVYFVILPLFTGSESCIVTCFC